METPLISVVVPVYKVEEYLDKCIQSLLEQTYSNYEVLLIDDGSPDNCGEICDRYAAVHEKIKSFHKRNGGLSDARNHGVKHAKGSHILFVDSDDYISPDCISSLVHLKNKYHADIAIGVQKSFKKKVVIREILETQFEAVYTPEEALKKMCYGVDFGVSACTKLFPIDAVKRNPFPQGCFYEDLATTCKYIAECGSIAYTSKVVYYYRQRSGSIRHDILSEKQLRDGLTASQYVVDFTARFFPSALHAAHARYIVFPFDAVRMIMNGNKQDKKMFREIQHAVFPHCKIVLRDREAPKRQKIKCIAMMWGYWPSILLWKANLFCENIRFFLFEM